VCWYCYDEDHIPDNCVVAMASTSTSNDPNWYLNSGATDHIMGELGKLTMHERYNNADQIHAANGVGMDITHVGKSVITSPSRPLHLNHVLHMSLSPIKSKFVFSNKCYKELLSLISDVLPSNHKMSKEMYQSKNYYLLSVLKVP
jgi:hypothetical protein